MVLRSFFAPRLLTKHIIFAVIAALILIDIILIFPNIVLPHKPSSMFHKLKSKFSGKDPKQELILDSETKTHYNGFRTCVYYSDWSIYDRKHFPEDIPLDYVSNIFYAFFNINPETGEVQLSDSWADTEIELQSPYNESKKVNGLLARFFEIKLHHRKVKVSMSIGGWSNGDDIRKGTDTPEKLQTFVDSALKNMIEYGFDGIDLDWEYPKNRKEAWVLLQMVKMIRQGMRKLEAEKGLRKDIYLLTIASPAFEEKLEQFPIKAMDKYLSFWNLMTYDFSGEWSEKAGYHCNLYKREKDELCADDAVQYFKKNRIDSTKITLGMANYGRSFTNTNGYGTKFNGVGPGSSDEPGIWNYNKLPLPGTIEKYDMQSVIAYNYDAKNKIFVSYDNPKSMLKKGRYARYHALGGGMWWESCGDQYDDPERSLIHNFVEGFGGQKGIDISENTIYGYASSEYLKANFKEAFPSTRKK